MKGRIAKRPWWTRRRCSCPTCGQIVDVEDGMIGGRSFKCPRCHIEMSAADFWSDHNDKYSNASDLTEEGTDEVKI